MTNHEEIMWKKNGAFLWETAHRKDGRMKMSIMNKCLIKHTDFFKIIVVTMVNIMNDLMLQWKLSWRMTRLAFNALICWVLPSYFMEEIGFYIWPKFKIRISSSCVRNSTLVLLYSTWWRTQLIILLEDIHDDMDLCKNLLVCI